MHGDNWVVVEAGIVMLEHMSVFDDKWKKWSRRENSATITKRDWRFDMEFDTLIEDFFPSHRAILFYIIEYITLDQKGKKSYNMIGVFVASLHCSTFIFFRFFYCGIQIERFHNFFRTNEKKIWNKKERKEA